MTAQCTGETTRVVRVTFHKKKTEVLRKKPFEMSKEETRRFRKRDLWRDGR